MPERKDEPAEPEEPSDFDPSDSENEAAPDAPLEPMVEAVCAFDELRYQIPNWKGGLIHLPDESGNLPCSRKLKQPKEKVGLLQAVSEPHRWCSTCVAWADANVASPILLSAALKLWE